MDKKNVIITGGAKGIGRAISLLFAKNNYNILINYNNSHDEAKKLLQYISQNYSNICCDIYKADISDYNEVKDMVNFFINRFEKIDVLINNAGISQQKLFTNITLQDWQNIINTNLSGTFYCSKLVAPNMIHNKFGKIINVSSIWGISGASCEVHYSAAKAGVIGFTKALAKELGPSNINVNCIAPGIIKTQMLSNLNDQDLADLVNDTPLNKLGDTESIAECALFLASEKSNFITGQIISPNGGFVI